MAGPKSIEILQGGGGWLERCIGAGDCQGEDDKGGETP